VAARQTGRRALSAQLSARGYDNTLREFAGVRHQISPAMAAYAVELLESAARNILQGGSSKIE
jgi:DNA-binding FadR family transcriptional regulator